MATNEKSEGKSAQVEGGRAQLTKAGEAIDLVAARAAAANAAVSTDLASELDSIDFHSMISGPLQAAVDAQVASSLATVDFINNVGFKPVDVNDPAKGRELVYVDFSYKRLEAGTTMPVDVIIRVPLLAIVPIPSLRIEHVTIDFNVKLNSVETATTANSFGIGGEVGGKFRRVNFKVSASYQRRTSTNVEVKKEYSLNVNVKAVQDEIPAGLEKVLNLLAA